VRKNNQVSFSQIANILTETDVKTIDKFSNKDGLTQIVLWALVSALVSSIALDLHPLFGLVAYTPIVGMVVWYSWLPPYRRAFLIWFSRYFVVQVAVIMFLAIFGPNGQLKYWIACTYIGCAALVAAGLVYLMRKQDIAYLVGRVDHPSIISKWLSVYLGGFIVLGMGFSYFYRTNKFWLREVSWVGANQVFDFLYTLLFIVMGISITFLPLVLFSSQQFAKDWLVKKYPEEFRKQAGIDGDRWYHVQ
jgi:hypothetical protein